MNSESTPRFLDGRVLVLVGDLTNQPVDAIVNAANTTLLGGGGVDGAIHRAGGPLILAECQQLRKEKYPQGLPTGETAITTAGNLPARYVIHTVGPIYGRNRELQADQLASCYHNSLLLAEKYSLSSIAFPSISTGAYGYPKAEAAEISSRAIQHFFSTNQLIKEVRLVFFHERDARVFLQFQKFE